MQKNIFFDDFSKYIQFVKMKSEMTCKKWLLIRYSNMGF